MWVYNNFTIDPYNGVLYLNDYLNKNINPIDSRQMLIDFYKKVFQSSYQNRKITMLNYIPTFKCLGQCVYCYNREVNNTYKNDLSLNEIQLSLKKLNELYELDPKISRVYGGEPFLSNELYSIINYFQETYNSFTYISTGMLFSNDHYLNIKKNLYSLYDLKKIGIGVSCDIGCDTRINPFEMSWVDIHERALDLSCMNIGHVVINLNLVNTCDFDLIFKTILKYTLNYNVYYRISIATGHNEMSLSKYQQELLYQFMLENIFNKQITIDNFPVNNFNMFEFKKIKDSTYLLVSSPRYCGLFTSMITIDPNGEFIHCHRNPKNKIYDLNEFQKKDDVVLHPKCVDCDIYPICRGECYYRLLSDDNGMHCNWLHLKWKNYFAHLDYYWKDSMI